MAAVTVKTFVALSKNDAIAQGDLDALSTTANAFLAGIAAANVLDILTSYSAPAGRFEERGSTFTYTVVYLA